MDALARLPRLGVGISAEFESDKHGIDAVAFHDDHPDLVHFVEYGGDLDRGLDDHVLRVAQSGLPTTYHFLDVNLEELEDVDEEWLGRTAELARAIGARWLCGDAGLWHFGPRDRSQMVLMPPVLTRESAIEMAEAIRKVEAATGFAVLPENPPGLFYLGDLHLLDYYALVTERAQTGMLLDCAHLAIFQRTRGLPPTTGLDAFPAERIIELHVAGGVEKESDGFAWVDDTHAPEPLDDTWQILEAILPRAKNLKAICYECERNRPEDTLANFARLNEMFPSLLS